jgi:NAD(P)-dependent dehydrogenase (short-subunit alcohol dehydrogenase family)
VIRHFGRLDAVVANAGEGTVGGVLETTSDEFDAQFSVKVHSVLHVVQAARPHLVQCDAPAVVVITGITAHAPDSDRAAVSTARAAVGNLVHLLARQLVVDGIRVNAVNLGAIATDPQRRQHEASGSEQDFEQWCAQEAARRKIPLGRMGRADEVAPTVALLVSSLSSYITGASVDVSGGPGARV